MPVWINSSLIDSSALDDLRRAAAFGVTTFFDQPGDDMRDSTSRALYSLDEHHNEVSQAPPYSDLQVFGARLGAIDESVLRDLGFAEFSSTNGDSRPRKMQIE